ncbi:hypothetical protein ACH42_08275 [Endozoicomonas sp. (ex Bugula neritina AB1)]|nr:hypothetical protein ACH42_08275 [Endozoicomonas sp. (ex Bugula neritina AB1)]
MSVKNNENKKLQSVPNKESQVELISYTLKLIKYERERIKNSIFTINQHTSDTSISLLLYELNEADRNYSELQNWQSVLMYDLAHGAK